MRLFPPFNDGVSFDDRAFLGFLGKLNFLAGSVLN